jgi:hypothetical protein
MRFLRSILSCILALIERNELEESENLSEMSVSRRCKVSTHCEFCKLNIQLAVSSLWKRSCRYPVFRGIAIIWIHLSMCLECCKGCLQQVVCLKKLYLLILSFLSPFGQFGLMSDDLQKVVNGNLLKYLHHFCISDDQGFSL